MAEPNLITLFLKPMDVTLLSFEIRSKTMPSYREERRTRGIPPLPKQGEADRMCQRRGLGCVVTQQSAASRHTGMWGTRGYGCWKSKGVGAEGGDGSS